MAIITYYGWYDEKHGYGPVYTLSSSPSVGDTAYSKVNGQFVEQGTVDSLPSSDEITTTYWGNDIYFSRDSSYDEIITITEYVSNLSDGTNTYVIKDANAADKDFSNVSSTGKSNITSYVLGNIQNTDSTKVGYVYQVSASNTSAIAPAGGKWLVLCSYIVRNSDGVVFNLGANVLHYSGEIVNGGTTIVGNAANHTTIVGLLKIE